MHGICAWWDSMKACIDTKQIERYFMGIISVKRDMYEGYEKGGTEHQNWAG